MDCFYLIAPEINAIGKIGVSRENIYCIAFNPERSTCEFDFGTAVQDLDKRIKQVVAGIPLARCQVNYVFTKFLGVTDTVNTRNRCYNNYIPSARKQGRGTVKPELFNLFVYGKIF